MIQVDEQLLIQLQSALAGHGKRLDQVEVQNRVLAAANAALQAEVGRLQGIEQAYKLVVKENEFLKGEVRRLTKELAEAHAANEALHAELAKLQSHTKELERQLFGRKSEKRPRVTPVDRELSAEDKRKANEKSKEAREKRRNKLKELPEEEVRHDLPLDEETHCECGRLPEDWKEKPETSVTYETHYIPGRFIRRKHIQQVFRCACGAFHKAPMPARVVYRGDYTPEVIAHMLTLKYADSIPYYRLEQQTAREGLAMPRSTMTDLTMDAATQLEPLYLRLGQLIRDMDIVQADETWHRMQKPSGKGTSGKGWQWVFLGDELDLNTGDLVGRLIYYVFRTSRSGETPLQVLGVTQGKLVVDAYSGYSRVTKPDGRARGGCLAHGRRRFFVAHTQKIPEAEEAIGLIRDVYRIEHEARERGVLGSAEHLRMRQTRSKPVMDRLHEWLLDQQRLHGPASTLGKAVEYSLNNWGPLTLFLTDARLPVDNNGAENSLRTVALGRKNYLFYYNEETGQKQAVIYSLVASCQANRVNPELYLADVLRRIDTTPDEDLDALLPNRWAASRAQA